MPCAIATDLFKCGMSNFLYDDDIPTIDPVEHNEMAETPADHGISVRFDHEVRQDLNRILFEQDRANRAEERENRMEGQRNGAIGVALLFLILALMAIARASGKGAL